LAFTSAVKSESLFLKKTEKKIKTKNAIDTVILHTEKFIYGNWLNIIFKINS
jgi:hypothetical protein